MPGPASADPPPSASSTPRKLRYGLSAEELVDGVRRCGVELGGPPTVAAYSRWARRQTPHQPGPQTITKRVGGWSEVLARAGLEATRRKSDDVAVLEDTRQTREAIAALRRFAAHAGVDGLDASDRGVAEQLGRGAYDLWHHDHAPDTPTLQAIRNALGTWSAGLHAAGLASSPDRPPKTLRFPDDALLAALRAAATELDVGGRLQVLEYQAWRASGPGTAAPTSRLIWERFRSWAAAMAAAGLGPEDDAATGNVLDALQRFLADGPPVKINPEAYLTWAARQPDRQPTARSLITEHGSWSGALQAAGATPPASVSRAPAWENDDMLDALRSWALADKDEQRRAERYRAWERAEGRSLPSDSTISLRFGSWKAALTAAGLQKREDLRERFRRLAPDALDNALAAFASSHPDTGLRSQSRYAVWRATHAPWAPSKRLLTVKYGNWDRVRDQLAEMDRQQARPAAGPRRRTTAHRRGRGVAELPPLPRPAN